MEEMSKGGASRRCTLCSDRADDDMSTTRKIASEALGTALLVAAVVGSGIMGERLSGGNVGIALLANAVATGTTLSALILAFGPISGAHFNPLVSLLAASQGRFRRGEIPGYVLAQFAGAFAGVATAHLMFSEPLFTASQHVRSGGAQAFSEVVATFGLLTIIALCSRKESSTAAFAVGAYITGAYWFTSSTSFANPAVTLARSLTNSFSGIRFADAVWFIAAQLVGLLATALLFRWLLPATSQSKTDRLTDNSAEEAVHAG
jgi:glycerol uptake facilitator-like aquaporin